MRDEYRATYHRLMKDRGVDFILSPAYNGVAAVLGESQYWNYTAIWNLLDQPSVILPTGLFQSPATDRADSAYEPRNDVDAREWAKYVPEKFDGAPICVQVTGKHFHDEQTLAASKLISDILKSNDL